MTFPVSFADGNTATITLGMGCFWSPDALFGSLPGVVRTRVGYAGGTAEHPTYREMGDHSETVEIEFAPRILDIESILQVFWNHHHPMNINGYKGRQYMSLLFYRDDEQQASMHRVKQRMQQEKGTLATEIVPYVGFTMAEDRHQKYYVKRFPDAAAKLHTLYPSPDELTASTLAARMNGLAKGYSNLERITQEIRSWPAGPDRQQLMIDLIKNIRW